MFALKYRYWFILLLAVYSFLNTLYAEALVYYRIDLPPGFVLGVFVLTVLLIWEGNRWLEHLLPKAPHLLGRPVHPLLVRFVSSLVITAVVVLIPGWLVGRFYLGYSREQMQLPLKLVLMFGFRVNLFLNTINAVYFFIQRFRETQLEAEQFKKISVQAQLQSLKNQVNPHFLFNNLNVLTSLVNKDPVTATEFIEEFSKVYRYVLTHSDKELIELSRELEFIRSYGYLLEKRFSQGLQISIDVPDAYLGYYVVPVALQMLFENAIKHNISSRNRPLIIQVLVTHYPADHSPGLMVQNNLQPKSAPEKSTKIGLENISRRYQFVSKRQVEVLQDEQSFRVTLPLIQIQHIS